MFKKEISMYETPVTYETKSFYDEKSPCVREYTNQFGFVAKQKIEYDYDSLVTEDDEPVDSIFSERQMRLLTDALYTSWKTNRIFMACANVGIYGDPPTVPIVPDVFLSMDVKPADDIWKKKNRCYMIDVFGKPPEVVIEVVSNTVGNERTSKIQFYASLGIKYYVIYDPEHHIFKTNLHAYQLKSGKYVAFPWKQIQKKGLWFSDLQLGMRIQKDLYQSFDTEWLVWFDHKGNVLLTGEQKARVETERANAQEQRANAEARRANEEAMRAKEALKELALLKAKLNLK
jgi:Uma2 family endonuclease